MKRIVALIMTILISAVPHAVFAAPAEGDSSAPVININNECIYIKVTEGDTSFSVYNVVSRFSKAPARNGNNLFVQADRFLTALGYTAKYDRRTKTLTASLGNETLSFSVKGKNNPVAYKEEKGTPLIAFEEFMKKHKFAVAWDAETKTCSASKTVDYKLGNMFMYDRAAKEQVVYSIAQAGLETSSYADIKINGVYPYKGKLAVYGYNKASKYNSLYIFDNGKFTELIKNFDIVDSYDFGNYKVFYGYANDVKKYQLYHFDGTLFMLVEGDCYSPKQTILGDTVIVGTFNKDRRYDIKAIDRNWQIKTLSTDIVPGPESMHPGLTLLDTLVSGEWAYFKAIVQGEQDKVYLIAYNGRDVKWVSLDAKEKELDFNHVRVCGNYLYVAFDRNKDGKRELLKVDTSAQMTSMISDALSTDYDLMAIESYKDKLYLSASIKEVNKPIKHSYLYEPSTAAATVLTYQQSVLSSGSAGTKSILYSAFKNSYVDNGRMYLMAGSNSPTKDLYIYDGTAWAYPVFGIISIESFIDTPAGTFLNVKDTDSMTNRSRNTVLLVNNSMKVENVALDYLMKNYYVYGQTLVYAGANTAPDKVSSRQKIKESVSSYFFTSREVIAGFAVKYWEPVTDTIYVTGNNDEGTRSYAVKGSAADKLKVGFVLTKAAATGNPRKLLMAGTDKGNTGSALSVLYVYDLDKKTYSLIGAGVAVENIVMY